MRNTIPTSGDGSGPRPVYTAKHNEYSNFHLDGLPTASTHCSVERRTSLPFSQVFERDQSLPRKATTIRKRRQA